MRACWVPILAFVLAGYAFAACEDTPYARAGPYAVAVVDATWTDPARARALPLRIYVPSADAAGKRPAVLFSHGLGGSKAGGEAWGRHWASHGFVAIHLQHPGSDDALWRDRGSTPLKDALRRGASPQAYVERLADVRFAVDEIGRRAAAGDAVASRIDLARLGMSGHSFGARTTQAVAGERLPLAAVGDRFRDDRLIAAIAFSPNVAGPPSGWRERYASIRIPFLSVTGTRDGDPFDSSVPASQRTEVFRNMPGPDKYLLVLDGADHLAFDGGKLTLAAGGDVDRCVRAATLAFWKAYLEGDGEAKAFLAGGDMAHALAAAGTFEVK